MVAIAPGAVFLVVAAALIVAPAGVVLVMGGEPGVAPMTIVGLMVIVGRPAEVFG
jgi:hypothetical protein